MSELQTLVRLELSQGEMAATFLRHEGFLGAVGAFLKVHPLAPGALGAAASNGSPSGRASERKVRPGNHS